MSKILDAATGVPRHYYICSTWWYPSAEECNESVVPMSADAVYDTLDEAINYQFENMSCLIGCGDIKRLRERATMFWDPVNDQLHIKLNSQMYRFLITRVLMNPGVE